MEILAKSSLPYVSGGSASKALALVAATAVAEYVYHACSIYQKYGGTIYGPSTFTKALTHGGTPRWELTDVPQRVAGVIAFVAIGSVIL